MQNPNPDVLTLSDFGMQKFNSTHRWFYNPNPNTKSLQLQILKLPLR